MTSFLSVRWNWSSVTRLSDSIPRTLVINRPAGLILMYRATQSPDRLHHIVMRHGMRYAIVDGLWTEAISQGQRGFCPGCLTDVYSRCPPNGLRHWVHFSKTMCAGATEPMTPWHREWQGEYPSDCRERPVVRNGKRHIADVLVNDFVLEFQHSRIMGPDIISREKTYRDMSWIVDASEHSIKFDPIRYSGDVTVGRWEFIGEFLDRYYYKCEKPLFLDIGRGQIILLKNMDKRGITFSGWCECMPRERFVDKSMTEWIKRLAPIEKPPKEKRDAMERSGRKHWDDDELGDVCSGTLEAIKNAEFAENVDFMESIRRDSAAGRFRNAIARSNYYGLED